MNYQCLSTGSICENVIPHESAKNKDFQFIKSIVKSDETPDYNGYNIINIRNNGQSLKSKTEVIFPSLLDPTPSDPLTVLTAMIEAENITNQAGQNITIFTADQQPWLKRVIGGVKKMLIGKKFSMKVRALRFAMLEMESFEDFDNFLESCSFIQKCFLKALSCKFH